MCHSCKKDTVDNVVTDDDDRFARMCLYKFLELRQDSTGNVSKALSARVGMRGRVVDKIMIGLKVNWQLAVPRIRSIEMALKRSLPIA